MIIDRVFTYPILERLAAVYTLNNYSTSDGENREQKVVSSSKGSSRFYVIPVCL